jgi:hypothetical protein
MQYEMRKELPNAFQRALRSDEPIEKILKF